MTKIPCFFGQEKHIFSNIVKQIFVLQIRSHRIHLKKQFPILVPYYVDFSVGLVWRGLVWRGCVSVPAMDDNGTGAASVGFVHLPINKGSDDVTFNITVFDSFIYKYTVNEHKKI
jgi:hypothetical protein